MYETKSFSSAKVDLTKTAEVVFIDGENLTFEHVSRVNDHQTQFLLSPVAKQKAEKSYRFVGEKLKSGTVVYGINTGFGRLANVSISPNELAKLQLNLIRSHCCRGRQTFINCRSPHYYFASVPMFWQKDFRVHAPS